MRDNAAISQPGNDRKSELSWLNLAYFLLVVWIHCASQPVTGLQRGSWQFFIIYSAQRLSFVAVYGFYFISGLKLTLPRSHPRTLTAYWKNRFKSIFLPYCLSVTVYYLIYTLRLHYFPFSLPDLLGHIVYGDLVAHYYFLIALFQFILLTPLLYWLSKRWSPVLLLPCALVVTLVCLQHLPDILRLFWPNLNFQHNGIIFTTYLFYYLAGCCAGQQYDKFLRLIRDDRGLTNTVFLLSGAFTVYLFHLSAIGSYYAPFLDQVHALYITAGILVSFQAALRLPQKMPGWLAKIERASYLIYLYHCLVLLIADALIRRLGITRLMYTFLLRTLITFTATPLACVIWQELVRRIKGTLQKN